MIFLFKKKKIVLDCFTDRIDVIESVPIQKSNYFYPDWWKKLPKSYYNRDEFWPNPTMKSCEGFIKQYNYGLMIPLWSDLYININSKNYSWKFSDDTFRAEIHDSKQRGDYLPTDKYGQLKLISPWQFRCDEEVQFMTMQPFWNLNSPEQIMIPPGVLEFKYQYNNNVNMIFFFDGQEKTFELEMGQPIFQMIPIDDRELVVNNHLVSREEMQKIKDSNGIKTFLMSYRKRKKIKKKNESKCPFGFGG